MPNITDQLNFTTPDGTQQAAFAVLDSIQGIQPKGLQLSAVAFMFLLMCQRFRQDPSDVLQKTDRVLHDSLHEGKGEYVRAIQDYMREEF